MKNQPVSKSILIHICRSMRVHAYFAHEVVTSLNWERDQNQLLLIHFGIKATCADLCELPAGEELESGLCTYILASTQFHPLLPSPAARRNNEVGNKEMETGHWMLQVGVTGVAQWLCSEGFKVISTDWTKHLCELDPVARLTGLKWVSQRRTFPQRIQFLPLLSVPGRRTSIRSWGRSWAKASRRLMKTHAAWTRTPSLCQRTSPPWSLQTWVSCVLSRSDAFPQQKGIIAFEMQIQAFGEEMN